jgi:hypothetical protein
MTTLAPNACDCDCGPGCDCGPDCDCGCGGGCCGD